jgi:Uma2 family endonuclease
MAQYPLWYTSPVTTSTRLTLEEFLAMPDIDERRLELIDGEVYEKMSPRWGHGRLALLIGSALDEFGYAAVEPRAVIEPAPDLGPSSPLPDVAFYRENPPDDDDWMRVPPDIAVEILSKDQNRRELRLKIDIYRAFGVPVVWVIDQQRASVDVYEGDARRVLQGDDVLKCSLIPEFALPLSDLFERPSRN